MTLTPQRIASSLGAVILAALLLLVLAEPSLAASGGAVSNPFVDITKNIKDTVVEGAQNLYIVGLIVGGFIVVFIVKTFSKIVAFMIIMAIFAPVVAASGGVRDKLVNGGSFLWGSDGSGGSGGGSGSSGGTKIR